MILDEIISAKKKELASSKRKIPLARLKEIILEQPPALNFGLKIRGHSVKLITEVKKASPSAGIIREDFNPVEIALTYADNGASAISVVTESNFFQGSLDYLRQIRQAVGSRLPLLRKDFIFEPYQVYESRANGADSLLLIVAVLELEKLKRLIALSRKLGMEPLVEIHDEIELKTALKADAGIIGINNRDLSTFRVDLATTTRLRPLILSDKIVVSESGIKDWYDITSLRHQGVDAVLVGEALLYSPDIAEKMKELLRFH